MTSSSDPNLIDFLTNDQNADSVLEVLKHGEAIRAKLTERFWLELRTHLSATTPASLVENLKWDLGSDATGKRKSYAWLDARLKNAVNQSQCLFYRLEYSTWAEGMDLYYGLHWKSENKTEIHLSKRLQELRNKLEEDEYDLSEPEWWCGWRFVCQHSSMEEFLSLFVKNPKSAFQKIGDDLWPFITRTISHIEKVNESFAG
jgi:hypothetical protein